MFLQRIGSKMPNSGLVVYDVYTLVQGEIKESEREEASSLQAVRREDSSWFQALLRSQGWQEAMAALSTDADFPVRYVVEQHSPSAVSGDFTLMIKVSRRATDRQPPERVPINSPDSADTNGFPPLPDAGHSAAAPAAFDMPSRQTPHLLAGSFIQHRPSAMNTAIL